jgi:hypothetical protein
MLGQALFSAALFVASVRAHGYVANVTIGGEVYSGWIPEVDPYLSPTPERIVRKIPGNGESEHGRVFLIIPHIYQIGPVTDLSLIE